MAGYMGFSMSNNAIEAYRNGEMPLSKWTKKAIIGAIEEEKIELKCSLEVLKKLSAPDLINIALQEVSWHHTSSHYNRTAFYALDPDRLEELTDTELKTIIVNSKINIKKEEPAEEKWECRFLEWSGSRKHPKAEEVTEIGTIKGKWFYRSDGSKKSTTANGFQFIKKIQ